MAIRGRSRSSAVAVLAAALLLLPGGTVGQGRAAADERGAGSAPEHAAQLDVRGTHFIDGQGREVVLRGFNVSGETKLAENGGLPFADVADARTAARAVRELGGANTVRFLLSWSAAQPAPGRMDETYVRQATAQIREFLAVGLRVLPDFHQDLYSQHLFGPDSWYQGDGAPAWVIEAGEYGKEFCGVCVHWGQNITQNQAVKDAARDFWHNRRITAQGTTIGVQDAFLDAAQATMRHLADHLSDAEFAGIAGIDPYNEPYAGQYEQGENNASWERQRLWPFYERFRARMDAAGWRAKPAFVEPGLFWNSNLAFMKEPGGLRDADAGNGDGTIGPRYVFNSHFYDQARMSGFFELGRARDGEYLQDFEVVRERSRGLNAPAIVSEFGHPLTGTASHLAPSVVKGQYQALDSAVDGRNWWFDPTGSGPVLSATQWQWDIYNGRHHEAMNGNPDKILTEGDAWNGEDLSAVHLDDQGEPRLRVDPRLVDRLYPSAVAGHTLAFTYEDRSRDEGDERNESGEGGEGKAPRWNQLPDSLPQLKRLLAGETDSGHPYGVLVWRGNGTQAPTELHLPQAFDPDTTTVVSDLGNGTITREPGGTRARRLLLEADGTGDAKGLHFALVTSAPSTPAERAAVRDELARWVNTSGFDGMGGTGNAGGTGNRGGTGDTGDRGGVAGE
ncbi:endoglycosylceramidase [Streptomyces sp. NPDC002851]